MRKNLFAVSAALLSVLPLSGCIGVAAGAGASVGVAAAQEGGIQGAASDTQIRMKVTDAWLKHDLDMYSRLSMTVKEGRVLVTGSVPTPDMRVDAIRLVWQVDGVKQVINEIRVDGGDGVTGYMTDTWVTGNIKTRLVLDKYIQSINYTIETVGGVVYVMGIAQDQKELDRVINYARNTKYVKNVVSYVRLRGEPSTNGAAPSSSSRAPSSSSSPASAPAAMPASSPAPVQAEPLSGQPG
jgi:osmotically-inducible protein OsmY